MAESSSATRMFPAGMESSSARAGIADGGEHGHQHAKYRVARLRLALDDAAVVANDFRDQGEPESAPAWLRRHERIEQMRHQIFGNARPVVLDAELERQRHARLATRQRETHAGPERGGEMDFPV